MNECARCQQHPCDCPEGFLSWKDHALALECAESDWYKERERTKNTILAAAIPLEVLLADKPIPEIAPSTYEAIQDAVIAIRRWVRDYLQTNEARIDSE